MTLISRHATRFAVESWRDECLYLDWSDAALDFKLGVLAATIRQVNDGRGADIIALQEVENVAVLERLRSEYLGDLGYLPAILVEGTDTRGIDVAFLSKLPLLGEPGCIRWNCPISRIARATRAAFCRRTLPCRTVPC